MDVLVGMVGSPHHTYVTVVERSLQTGGLAERERERKRPRIIEKERASYIMKVLKHLDIRIKIIITL